MTAILSPRGALRFAEGTVPAEGRIGLVPQPTEAWARTLFAAWDAGLSVVLFHPRWTEREIVQAANAIDVHEVRRDPIAAFDDPTRCRNEQRPDRIREREACVLFSSGTSGAPKPIAISHGALAASAEATAKRLELQPDDRWLGAMPIAHVGGLSILARCWLGTITAVLQPRFDPDAWLDALVRHRIHIASVVPTMVSRLLTAPGWERLRQLSALICGGAPMSQELHAECRARRVPICTTYGMTETAAMVTLSSPGEPWPEPPASGLAFAGSALAGAEIAILGAEDAALDPGELGEIAIRGDTLMTGYVGMAARSPAIWFRTGDIGTRSNAGHLWVRGRHRDLIITGGENVSPTEIEEVVRRFWGIRQAVVFGVDDAELGQRVAIALVVDEQAFDAERFRAFLRHELAGFKRPRLWTTLDELPVRSLDKPDRVGLAARLRTSLRALG